MTYSDHSATDNWTTEWVKLVLGDGTVIKCPINGSIDGYRGYHPKYLEFDCHPEQSLIKNDSPINFDPEGRITASYSFNLRPDCIWILTASYRL